MNLKKNCWSLPAFGLLLFVILVMALDIIHLFRTQAIDIEDVG